MRKLIVAAAAVAALAAPVAATATTYTDTIAGIEIPPITSTLGTFTGVAGGQLPGTWYAQIVHEPLSSGSTVAVTGGTFVLQTIYGSTLDGAVTGGTVTVTNTGAGCTNQTFAVDATLTIGSFSGTLTHYRTRIFGRCVIYSASITGNATFTA